MDEYVRRLPEDVSVVKRTHQVVLKRSPVRYDKIVNNSRLLALTLSAIITCANASLALFAADLELTQSTVAVAAY